MLKIEETIRLNRFAQSSIDVSNLEVHFANLTFPEKKVYLQEIIGLILQSKPLPEDIEYAIQESNLKPTHTPCVLLKKGVERHNLLRITELPDDEQGKALSLLLNLFKISYQRRFQIEKNNPNKWWYWDLSEESNIQNILRIQNG